jgi:hypothetical protein
VGASGPAGPQGETGPAGPPGDIAKLDWPFIAKTNWPQDASLSANDALALLQKVQLSLSSPLSSRTQERQPLVVQIWFEPAGADATGAPAVPVALQALHGSQKLSPRDIVWTSSDNKDRLSSVLSASGRLMLRVHCGHLVDEKERSFSSSVDALVGVQSPHLPAGVFEGWCFVGSNAVRAPVTAVKKRRGGQA